MRSAQSAAGSGVNDADPGWSGAGEEGPGAAAGATWVLMDGGHAPVIVSMDGRDTWMPLLGLGTAILTTVDPCGTEGTWEGAAVVIWM